MKLTNWEFANLGFPLFRNISTICAAWPRSAWSELWACCASAKAASICASCACWKAASMPAASASRNAASISGGAPACRKAASIWPCCASAKAASICSCCASRKAASSCAGPGGAGPANSAAHSAPGGLKAACGIWAPAWPGIAPNSEAQSLCMGARGPWAKKPGACAGAPGRRCCISCSGMTAPGPGPSPGRIGATSCHACSRPPGFASMGPSICRGPSPPGGLTPAR
mmetsp:Transcript_37016/g.105803  ORF Transcript_37016/g.105803 Transcript_37016/m.105803 type:complete len:229 (+) Transcript_37016:1377-2063(+)